MRERKKRKERGKGKKKERGRKRVEGEEERGDLGCYFLKMFLSKKAWKNSSFQIQLGWMEGGKEREKGRRRNET